MSAAECPPDLDRARFFEHMRAALAEVAPDMRVSFDGETVHTDFADGREEVWLKAAAVSLRGMGYPDTAHPCARHGLEPHLCAGVTARQILGGTLYCGTSAAVPQDEQHKGDDGEDDEDGPEHA